MPECDADFASRVNLSSIPDSTPLPKLTAREITELELSLQIGDKFDRSKRI